MECVQQVRHDLGGFSFEKPVGGQCGQVVRSALQATDTNVNTPVSELVDAVSVAKQTLRKPYPRDAETTAKGVGGRNEISDVHGGNYWGIFPPSSTGYCSLSRFWATRAIYWRHGNP